MPLSKNTIVIKKKNGKLCRTKIFKFLVDYIHSFVPIIQYNTYRAT